MLRDLRTVNDWHNTSSTTSSGKTCLRNAFEIGLGRGTNPQTYLFEDIYVPIRKRDGTTHAFIEPAEFTYVNVGMTVADITDLYWTQYQYNMLANGIIDRATGLTDDLTLGKKINLIVKKNLYKYFKWLDEMGYAYNPLWNVDGTEIEQTLDNHGGVQKNVKPILATDQKLQTNSYDSTLRDTQKTTTTYNSTDGTVVGLVATSEEKHEHAKNKVNGEDADYTVGANDTAFGTALTGGDYMHVEKRIRQGNIGVTKTTELIESERELVRFNLIQEFFNDINHELLVGIYPDF